MENLIEWKDFDTDTKQCFIDNYGAINLSGSYIVCGNIKFNLSERDMYKYIREHEDVLRKDI